MAGLTGGPGLAPGCNVGDKVTIFEQGARHIALDIAGKGIANPGAALFSTAMMLRHLHLPDFSDRRGAPTPWPPAPGFLFPLSARPPCSRGFTSVLQRVGMLIRRSGIV